MQSQVTVRLPEGIEKGVSNLAKKLHLKRSDIVRMALERFIEEFGAEKSDRPYEQVSGLIGAIATGVPDLGESHRKHLLGKLKRA